MPSIKDFDKKKKKHTKKKEASEIASDDLPTELKSDQNEQPTLVEHTKTTKRRPSQLDADSVEVSEELDREPLSGSTGDDGPSPETFQSFSEATKFELNFPFSFLVKSKIPKTFDLAERIAGDWINDGKFESLPVGHPLAQIVAASALTKAKTIEKKVLNSTPVTLAKIGLEYAKSKIKR